MAVTEDYFTAIQLAEIERRVDVGIELLDAHVPDWYKVILQNADRFAMRDECDCVLGLKFGTYTEGFERLQHRIDLQVVDYDDDVYLSINMSDAMQYGFDAPHDNLYASEYTVNYYNVLTEIWLRKAHERLNQTSTPAQ